MKTYSKIMMLAAVAVLTACGNEFLNIRSTSADVLEDYYKTEAQIYKTLVGAYDPLQWSDYYGGYNQFMFLSDLRGDDIYVGGDKGSDNFFHQMQRFQMQPIDAPRSFWENMYTGIERCNTVIDNLPKVEDISPVTAERYEAEARFLRAWYYHWLWKFWGNIPYFDHVLEAPYVTPQMPADSVYTHILADLDYCCEKSEGAYRLMDRPAEDEWGRVTIYAAMMLRARVVLFQNDKSRFEQVYNDMDIIKRSALFTLCEDYDRIWLGEYEFVTDPDMMNKSESIWEINHRSEGGSWSWPQGGQGTIFPKFIGINGLDGDPEYQDGWGFGPIRKAAYLLYDAEDQRRDASIIDIVARKQMLQDSLGITISWAERANHTGYYNKKYTARKGYNECSYDPELNFNNNIRVFRYSECLLNLAEVSMRLGYTRPAQTNLDLVRKRAYPGENYGSGSPHYKAVSMEAIMLERRLEFMGEGHRFWDLVRWSHSEDVNCDISAILSGTDEIGNYSRTWNDNWKWLPIPSLEIDRTEGEHQLKQNPGY